MRMKVRENWWRRGRVVVKAGAGRAQARGMAGGACEAVSVWCGAYKIPTPQYQTTL